MFQHNHLDHTGPFKEHYLNSWTPFNTQSEKSLRMFAHTQFGLRLDKSRICNTSNPHFGSVKFVEVNTNRCVHTADNLEDAAKFMIDEFKKRQSKDRERQHEVSKRAHVVVERAARIIMGSHVPFIRTN